MYVVFVSLVVIFLCLGEVMYYFGVEIVEIGVFGEFRIEVVLVILIVVGVLVIVVIVFVGNVVVVLCVSYVGSVCWE